MSAPQADANRRKQVVVVEDDPFVRATLVNTLTGAGYQVTALPSGDTVERVIESDQVSLAVIDLSLPDVDGLTLTRRLRERYDIGIIIVSGRGDTTDRVIGLEVGADDYLPKPFEPRELLARVKSVLRRFEARTQATEQARAQRFGFDGWVLDLAGMSLANPDAAPVYLTGGEFKLLEALVTHANRVLSRDRLMDLVHERDSPAFDRSIDMSIGRLRKKLGDSLEEPRFIKTVRNAGYAFVARVNTLD